MNYSLIVDVVVVLLVVLFAVLGVKRGMIKTCSGLITSILVLVISVVAVNPLTTLVCEGTEWDDKLANTLESPISEKLPNAYAKIYYYNLDGDVSTEDELIFENNNERKPFDQIFEGSVVAKLGITKTLRPLVSSYLEEQGEDASIYFVDSLTYTLTSYIMLAAVFVALSIICAILVRVLLYLLKKIVSRIYIAHYFDKMLGGLFGLGIGAFVVLVLFTILQFMSGLAFMNPVNAFLEDSVVCKFIMDNNFMYTFISSRFDVSSLFNKFGG